MLVVKRITLPGVWHGLKLREAQVSSAFRSLKPARLLGLSPVAATRVR